MTQQEIKAFLIQLRIELGLKQEEVAKRAGVSPSTMSLWESGGREPPLEALERWALALRIRLSLEPRPRFEDSEGAERLSAIAAAVEAIEVAPLEEVRALRVLLDVLKFKATK